MDGRATDDELLAMIADPEEWSAEALDAAQAELRRRGVPFTPPAPAPAPQPMGRGAHALGLLVTGGLTVGVISAGWGPRPTALFALPAAYFLGMTIRRVMGH